MKSKFGFIEHAVEVLSGMRWARGMQQMKPLRNMSGTDDCLVEQEQHW